MLRRARLAASVTSMVGDSFKEKHHILTFVSCRYRFGHFRALEVKSIAYRHQAFQLMSFIGTIPVCSTLISMYTTEMA